MTMNGKNPPSSIGAEKPAAVVSDVGQFAIIPTWLLMSGVSDRAVRLYACLAGKYANFKTQEAFPSRRALATDLGCSLSSADRAIDELIGVRALTVEQRQANNGDFISNIYKIRIATPEGQRSEEVSIDQAEPAEVTETTGGVYSPVTRGVVTGEQGVYSPVNRGLVTGDDTEEIIPTEPDQERTPPNPLAGGKAVVRPSMRKPSKAEQQWASQVLGTRHGTGCPHEPRCETRAKCIGKLVMFQRQQTLEGMHEELGLGDVPVPPHAQPARRETSQHADTS